MKRTVMVVHPDPAVSKRIEAVVAASGHEAIPVPDGERAIDRFIMSPTDAMIVEMVLPGRDGETTVESVRWAPGGDAVVVILLAAGQADPGRLEAVGRNVGALATLAGPLNEAALATLLSGMGDPHSGTTQVGEPGRGREAPARRSARAASDDTTAAGGRALDLAELTTRPEVPTAPIEVDPAAFLDIAPTDVDEPAEPWTTGDDPTAEREGREVERRVRTLGRYPDDRAGTLNETPFPRLLHELAEGRAKGGLALEPSGDTRRTTTGESPKKIVFYRNGVPVYVQSNLVQECLGQVLARGGHISREVLEESVRRTRAGEGRQGAVLLSMGAITPRGLRDALEDQLRVKLFDLFAWADGTYRFSASMEPPAEIVTLEMSLAAIVMRGVVHRIPPQRLLAMLSPHMDRYVIPAPARMEVFRSVVMAAEARRVLHSLDGTERIRDLLARAGDRPGAAAQLLYSLHCLDAVVFASVARPTPRMASRPEDDPGDAGPSSLAAMREELSRMGRLLREKRYTEALGVPPGDSVGAARARERLTARFRAMTQTRTAPRDLRALAYEVCARLVHAERAVSGWGTAVGSEDALFGEVPTRDERGRRGSAPGSDDAGASRGSDAGATRATKRGGQTPAGRALGAPPGRRPSDSGLTPDELISAGAGDHPGSPGGAPPPAAEGVAGSRAQAATDGRSSRAGDQGGPGDQDGRSNHDALDERVRRLYEAERHFRRGDRALTRGRAAEAVESFKRAVTLCPEEGEFLAHLGYARYQLAPGEPGVARQATEELARSCELSPKLDLTHLLRARVLRDLGESAGARDAYERALAANPECEEALAGLRAVTA